MLGVNRRYDLQVKLDVASAWHAANFARAKKLKSLKDVLKQMEPAKPTRVQTLAELEAALDRLVAMGKAKVSDVKDEPNAR